MLYTAGLVTNPNPLKLTSVTPTGATIRQANGNALSIPAVYDGNKENYVYDFKGSSYQWLTVDYPSAIDFVDLTVWENVSRGGAWSISYAGTSLESDARTLFTTKCTRRWSTPRKSGQLYLGTAATSGRVQFFEITGWVIST